MTQALEAIFYHGDQQRIDYTPSGAAVSNGQIVLMTGLTGICTTVGGIADGYLGALAITGTFKVKKAVSGGVTFARGARVAWDDSGNTAVAAGTGTADIGLCEEASVDADDHVKTFILPGLNTVLNILAGITVLTDSSAGTANNTVESMADTATAGGATPTAAQVDTAVNAVLAKIRNNFADLAAKVNAIIAALST